MLGAQNPDPVTTPYTFFAQMLCQSVGHLSQNAVGDVRTALRINNRHTIGVARGPVIAHLPGHVQLPGQVPVKPRAPVVIRCYGHCPVTTRSR
jgi:hypothetical protein